MWNICWGPDAVLGAEITAVTSRDHALTELTYHEGDTPLKSKQRERELLVVISLMKEVK